MLLKVLVGVVNLVSLSHVSSEFVAQTTSVTGNRTGDVETKRIDRW
jgi:hypothetical protein